MAGEKSASQFTEESEANEISHDTQILNEKYQSEKGEDINDEDWELVDMDDCSEPTRLDGNGTSLHFDVTLGWGHWRHTLCSVDYTVTVQPLEESNEESEK